MATELPEALQLDIWDGDWGLPSVDHQCLAVMTYCRFSDVPVKFHKCNNPWKSPTGELPVLRHEGGTETKVTDIFNFLRKQNWGTDHELTAKQSADLLAFVSCMEEKLLPALLHLWWVDSRTYVEFTRPWFARALPFPLSLYMPLKKHKEYVNRLSITRGDENVTDSDREIKIYKDAKECLNMLSAQLAEKDYFFGKTPSSLDAVVVGYLAPLLKAPFPNTMLQNHLKACSNLCQMCNRVLDTFFPLSDQEKEDLEKQEEDRKNKQAEQNVEFPHRKRNMMVSGMVALTAMVGYAFMSGLVQIEVTNVEDKQEPHVISDSPQAPNFGQFDKLFDKAEDNKQQEEGEQGQDTDD